MKVLCWWAIRKDGKVGLDGRLFRHENMSGGDMMIDIPWRLPQPHSWIGVSSPRKGKTPSIGDSDCWASLTRGRTKSSVVDTVIMSAGRTRAGLGKNRTGREEGRGCSKRRAAIAQENVLIDKATIEGLLSWQNWTTVLEQSDYLFHFRGQGGCKGSRYFEAAPRGTPE